MRKRSKAVIWTVVLVLAVWTGIQFIGTVGKKETYANAKVMLYEVSLFQIELVSGFVAEAAAATATDQLNGLKQAAFSAEYTHNRLLQASGSEFPSLRSVSGLMEWIVRLQIGGGRKINEQELQLFTELGPYFQELYEGYAAVMNADGRIDRAAADRVREADKRIMALLSGYIE